MTSTMKSGAGASRDGHEGNGRFAKGNAGGPGDPFGQRMAANRDAILDAVGPEEIKCLLGSLYQRGMEGNIPAARLVLLYATGRPQTVPMPDAGEVEEREVAARAPQADSTATTGAKPVGDRTTDSPAPRGKVEAPFAPLDDGTGAKRGERRKTLGDVVDSLRDGKFRDESPFAPFGNGGGALPTAADCTVS